MKTPLIISLICATAIAGGQTLENPSFEEPGPTPTEIHAWGSWGEGFFRVHSSEWAPVHQGEAMLGFRHWESTNQDTAGVFQDAQEITAGTLYEFSVMVYLDTPDGGSLPDTIELRLEAEIEGEMATVATRSFEPEKLDREKWIKIHVMGIAPEENLRTLIIVTPAEEPGGAVKFDSAQLTK